MRILVSISLTCFSLLFASDAGRDFGIERSSYIDSVTGLSISEITRPGSASDNLYYHFSNFTADDRYLVFISNRAGSRQLFRYTVDDGHIVQLTDDRAVAADTACPDRQDARALYVVRGREVIRLDIQTFKMERIATIPEPASDIGQLTQSPDRKFLAVSKRRDAKTWEIGLMDVQTGAYRTVITQGFQIGHVQHSPVRNEIFYVWETGGYAPQRSWVVNQDGSGNRPYYAAPAAEKAWITPLKEWVTHESYVASSGDMTMIIDKVGAILVRPDGTMRMIRDGSYWHCRATEDGRFLGLDDQAGRIWISSIATGSVRLLATGTRAKVPAHAHLSFDHSGRWLQFHSGRSHETVALIDLKGQLD